MLTNNHIEGWHHGFDVAIRPKHRHFYKFLNELQTQEAAAETCIAQIEASQQVCYLCLLIPACWFGVLLWVWCAELLGF